MPGVAVGCYQVATDGKSILQTEPVPFTSAAAVRGGTEIEFLSRGFHGFIGEEAPEEDEQAQVPQAHQGQPAQAQEVNP